MDATTSLVTDYRQPAVSLAETDIPAGPGAYVWWDGDDPVHVGATASLARQILEQNLVGGRSPIAPAARR